MNIIRYLLYARYFTYTTSLILYYNSMRLWQGFWGKNYHHLFWIRNGGSEGLSCLRFPNWVGLTWKLCMVHRADDLTRDTLEHDKQVVRAMEEYQSLNCKAVQDSDYTISLPICPMCSPLGHTHTQSSARYKTGGSWNHESQILLTVSVQKFIFGSCSQILFLKHIYMSGQ